MEGNYVMKVIHERVYIFLRHDFEKGDVRGRNALPVAVGFLLDVVFHLIEDPVDQRLCSGGAFNWFNSGYTKSIRRHPVGPVYICISYVAFLFLMGGSLALEK